MLVAGVVFGVLLGPAVFKRASPQAYDQLFIGSGDTSEFDQAVADLKAFHNGKTERELEIDGILAQAESLDPDDSAYKSVLLQIDEKINGYKAEQERKEATIEDAKIPILLNQDVHRDKLQGMSTAMLLLFVIVLATESILSPQRDELEQGQAALPPALSRLITVRYGLAAGWLMLMLAQPVWLRGIDLTFGVVLLVVVLIAGLVPLGKQAA